MVERGSGPVASEAIASVLGTGGQPIEQQPHFFGICHTFQHSIAVSERPERVFECSMSITCNPVAPQPYSVQSKVTDGFAANQGVGDHVLTQRDVSSDHTERTDAHELVRTRTSAHDGIAPDMNMATEHDAITQGHLIFHDAVVPDMGVRHEYATGANTRDASGLKAPIDGYAFAYDIVVAQFSSTVGVDESGIPWRAAYDCPRVDEIARADARVAPNNRVRADDRPAAYADFRLNDSEGADFHLRSDLSVR